MSNFKVGQRVVCIKSFKGEYDCDIVKGKYYFITSTIIDKLYGLLVNVDNQKHDGDLTWWEEPELYFRDADDTFAEETVEKFNKWFREIHEYDEIIKETETIKIK